MLHTQFTQPVRAQKSRNVFLLRVRSHSDNNGSLLGGKEISVLHENYNNELKKSRERLKHSILEQLQDEKILPRGPATPYVEELLHRQVKLMKDHSNPGHQTRTFTRIERLVQLQKNRHLQDQHTQQIIQHQHKVIFGTKQDELEKMAELKLPQMDVDQKSLHWQNRNHGIWLKKYQKQKYEPHWQRISVRLSSPAKKIQ